MKRLSALVGTFPLLCLGVLCAVYALITTFSFPVEDTLLVSVCLLGALAAAVCTALAGMKGAVIGLPVALAAFYFVSSEVWAGARAVLYAVTAELNAYGAIPVCFPGAEAAPRALALFFGAAGVFLSFALAAVMTARRSVLPAVMVTLPFFVPAFAIVVLPPAMWCAVGLLGFYLVLLFRDALTAEPGRRRGMGTAAAALALVGITLAVGRYLAPPEDYEPEDWATPLVAEIRQRIPILKPVLDQINDVELPAVPLGIWYYNTARVSIADQGARTNRYQRILGVTAEAAGDYYLRGHSMAYFDGRAWQSAELESSFLSGVAAYRPAARLAAYNAAEPENAQPLLSMTVTNYGDLTGILYLPYYPDFSRTTEDASPLLPVWQEDSYLSGTAREYTVHFYHPSDSLPSLIPPTADGADDPLAQAYGAFAQEFYTRISAGTAQELRALAAREGIETDGDRRTVAAQVAAYVMSAARYNLRATPVPVGEDFALYFLTESKRGYCIHFATAATLMLRALDIPARFTSGFLVEVTEAQVGRETRVTDADAHAWVEVYYHGVGWVPMEVTPPYSVAGGVAAPPTPSPGEEIPGEVTPPRNTPTPEATPTPSPGQTAPPPQTADGEPGGTDGTAMAVFLAVLAAAALAALTVLGRDFARKQRAARFAGRDTNAAALHAWRYILRLQGEEEEPPEELEELALKARFSLHTLTEEERAAVVDYAYALAKETDAACNVWGKLRLRYVYRLY